MSGQIVILSHVVTNVLNNGFLPAAKALGLQVFIVTDQASRHREYFSREGLPAYPDAILGCDVFNPVATIETLQEAGIAPVGIFSHSDHLQTSTALVADYFGLPGKDWRVCFRANNKAAMRDHLAALGDDPLWYRLVSTQEQLARVKETCPYPCVIKPREGVASQDVALVTCADELVAYCDALWREQPRQPLLLEEYLVGPLYTLETLGDGQHLQVLGGFRVDLSAPPHFIELGARWGLDLDAATVERVVRQIERFGVGFGSCHTEFVMTANGPRLIEINYRTIGDGREFLLEEALGIPLFKTILQLHLGEPLSPLAIPQRPLLIHYLCTSRAGQVSRMPAAFRESLEDGFVDFQPLRGQGERVALTHSNKDYLGVIRAAGASWPRLEEVVAGIARGLELEVSE